MQNVQGFAADTEATKLPVALACIIIAGGIGLYHNLCENECNPIEYHSTGQTKSARAARHQGQPRMTNR